MSKHKAKEIGADGDCIYNIGVSCEPNQRKCERCGWNPIEAERRARELRAKLRETADGKET